MDRALQFCPLTNMNHFSVRLIPQQNIVLFDRENWQQIEGSRRIDD
jgi:hypothetical protein